LFVGSTKADLFVLNVQITFLALRALYSLLRNQTYLAQPTSTAVQTTVLTALQLRGEAIVTNMERDPYMVDDLLALKNDVDTVVSESFGKSEKFRNATKDAFEAFINKRQNKPAECIGVIWLAADATARQGIGC
jgi:hypothetical protein